MTIRTANTSASSHSGRREGAAGVADPGAACWINRCCSSTLRFRSSISARRRASVSSATCNPCRSRELYSILIASVLCNRGAGLQSCGRRPRRPARVAGPGGPAQTWRSAPQAASAQQEFAFDGLLLLLGDLAIEIDRRFLLQQAVNNRNHE